MLGGIVCVHAVEVLLHTFSSSKQSRALLSPCLHLAYHGDMAILFKCRLPVRWYHTLYQTATFGYGWFISLLMAEGRPKRVASGTECDPLWSLRSPVAVLSIFLISAELSAKDKFAVYCKATAGQLTLSELHSGASNRIDAGRPVHRQLRVRLRTGICGFLLCLTDKCTKYLLTLIYVF